MNISINKCSVRHPAQEVVFRPQGQLLLPFPTRGGAL